jgi:hypothetical protein
MDVRLRPQVLFYNVSWRLPKHPESKNPDIVAEAVLADPENAEAGALTTQSAIISCHPHAKVQGKANAKIGRAPGRFAALSSPTCCGPANTTVFCMRLSLEWSTVIRLSVTGFVSDTTRPQLIHRKIKARRREWEAPGLHHCAAAD